MKPTPEGRCSHNAPPAEWMEQLRSRAGRVTRARPVVVDARVRLQRPSTPEQIAEAGGKPACHPATFYRSMIVIERLGLVHRSALGDGRAWLEVADDNPRGHHRPLCRPCDRIVKLDDCVLAKVEFALARQDATQASSIAWSFAGGGPHGPSRAGDVGKGKGARKACAAATRRGGSRKTTRSTSSCHAQGSPFVELIVPATVLRVGRALIQSRGW